ncbi:hypothetical protein [Cohaesibacter sp. ES.047]|nr:hypothetical protein [Cohaesibacter sp. ES.047]
MPVSTKHDMALTLMRHADVQDLILLAERLNRASARILRMRNEWL